MESTTSVEQRESGFLARVRLASGFVYQTDVCEMSEDAAEAAGKWQHWYENVAKGTVESIYYIVSVPEIWAGPLGTDHRYSGLSVKIGRARNVTKRLANLRTGSSADLIIHALEPGSPSLERQRHKQFAEDRRQGEWFSCSLNLTTHIFNTWARNNALPPEQQIEVLRLQDRIDALLKARDLIGGAPDMINPSLDEPWEGTVLLDFAYAGWRVSMDKPLRPGAIQIDPETLARYGFK